MALRTVRVPPEMEPLFAQAESVVARYFQARRDDPSRGTIEIAGERYVLVRAASLSVDFFATVSDLFGAGREAEADEFARNILFDLAHAIGRSDARNFHAKMGVAEPMAKLSAGPVHFAHAGWAFVDIAAGESNPVPDESFCLVYDHPYSFEADAWIGAAQPRVSPSCIMNAGYSSGWCEESFGVVLVATEVRCRACGDDVCRFVMAPPSRIEERARGYLAGQPVDGRAARPLQIPDFFSRKRAEEQLRRAHAELEQRVLERTDELKREMEQRAAAERRLLQKHKLDALGQLAGGIAHDFNNLMAVVQANTELLAEHLSRDPFATKRVELVQGAIDRAAELTRRLLAFSRAEAPGWQPVDLDALVTDVGKMLDRVIGEHIRLKVTTAGGWVEADRGQLEQVLVNLALNARDAMPGGGELTISTSLADAEAGGELAAGRYVALDVTDTGVGMDQATQAHLFEPFFTTRPDGGGTGLGLSTAYGIVRQHRGQISVIESAPGKGTRFRVLLPAIAARAPEEPRPVAPIRGAVPRGHETVLVVEDQAPLRNVVAEMLRRLGYTVVDAADPEQAAAMTDEELARIDVVLSDVLMPAMTGPELAAALRARRPGLRVLYMSGYTREVADLGQDELLEKPFTLVALARSLRATIDK
jgi:two-component system cell cycle sensor histidine kinase/response regulator CckA